MIKSVLIFLMLILSCNSTKISTEQHDLSFNVILERSTGGRTTDDIVTVTDLNALEAIYSDINLHQTPDFVIPKINFKTELVIVFFMGEKNTGGYSISIDSLNESETHIEINYQEKSPKPTDMSTMALTQPYCIVKINKPSKELKFTKID